MKRPRAHAQLVHRAAYQRFAGVVQLAVFADVCRTHTCTCIARYPRSIEAGELSIARRQHALPHDLARLTCAIGGEFLVIDARHVHALRESERSSSGPEILF
jgi:hypothetical protein